MQGEEKEMKIILNRVPNYVQFAESVRESIRPRACTIACLKMAMEYVLGRAVPSIDELFDESEIIQQHMLSHRKMTQEMASHGRAHDTIVKVAHNHGCVAHKEEFRSIQVNLDGTFSKSQFEESMYEAGINRICQSIANNSPVIVSVNRRFEENGTPHSILIVGVEKGSGFYYREPDSVDDTEAPVDGKFVGLSGFREHWRRLAIFVDALSP